MLGVVSPGPRRPLLVVVVSPGPRRQTEGGQPLEPGRKEAGNRQPE